MSNPSTDGEAKGNGRAAMGVQAYRWMVTVCMALLAALSWRVLDQVDKTAAKVDSLWDKVTTLATTTESRINAHLYRLEGIDRLNETQNRDIKELERRAYQMSPPRAP